MGIEGILVRGQPRHPRTRIRSSIRWHAAPEYLALEVFPRTGHSSLSGIIPREGLIHEDRHRCTPIECGRDRVAGPSRRGSLAKWTTDEAHRLRHVSRQRRVEELSVHPSCAPTRASPESARPRSNGRRRTVETLLHEWVRGPRAGARSVRHRGDRGRMIRDQYQGGSTVMTAISGSRSHSGT